MSKHDTRRLGYWRVNGAIALGYLAAVATFLLQYDMDCDNKILRYTMIYGMIPVMVATTGFVAARGRHKVWWLAPVILLAALLLIDALQPSHLPYDIGNGLCIIAV